MPGQVSAERFGAPERLLIALVVAGCVVAQIETAAATETCSRAEFEMLVDSAGGTLRAMTQERTPQIQTKLRALKDKRGWSDSQLLSEGARLVQNPEIAGFEQKAATLLAKINGADEAAPPAAGDDCARLAAMKANLEALVAIQNQKWSVMFSAIDAELAK